MYKLLIKKIMRDYALAEGEEKRRCENVVAFWVKESEKYTRLVKKLNAGDNISFDDLLLNFGYWFRFKLLCEGKKPTIENVIVDGFDLYRLKLFIMEINSLPDD